MLILVRESQNTMPSGRLFLLLDTSTILTTNFVTRRIGSRRMVGLFSVPYQAYPSLVASALETFSVSIMTWPKPLHDA